jgi:pimeloyl-ACP methyl ester carboxylesterase
MRFAGMPADQVEGMRQAPFWPGMEAIAPTLAYDHAAIIGARWATPTGLAAQVPVPALVIAGHASMPFMPETLRALSMAMPHGQTLVLEGQTHDVNPGVLAPVLVDFFTSGKP